VDAVAAVDPAGDGEHDSEVPNATDGNVETYWTTSRYSYPDGGFGKAGVGIQLETNRPPSTVVVQSNTPGFTADIRSGNTIYAPPAAGRDVDHVHAAVRHRAHQVRPLDHEPRAELGRARERGDGPLGENRGVERKVATVLFADLVDSTGLGEATPSRHARCSSASTLRWRRRSSSRRDGREVRRRRRDGGVRRAGRAGGPRGAALHAALRCSGRLPGGLAMRVGVNTGEVVSTSRRREARGSPATSSTSARALEQDADVGEVLVGERTAQRPARRSSSTSCVGSR
jgi:hypothetical protein